MLSTAKTAFFMGAIFLSLGIYLPFFPSWLDTKGFSATQVAMLLSAPLAVKVIFTPFLTALAGRVPQRRQAAVIYCLIAFLAFGMLGFTSDFWLILILLGVFGVFWHALIPLGDSFALTEVRRNGANYGMIRLWGSITFVLANLSAGYLLGSLGSDGAFFLIVITLAVAVISAFFLPYYGVSVSERPGVGVAVSTNLIRFLRDPDFFPVILSAGLLQASHALLYGFGTIDWLERGYSTGQIGVFWSVGVLAEIVLFTQASKLFRSLGPYFLLGLGGGAAVLRWLLHGDVDGFWLIVILQGLHGLSFGATHLGVQAFIVSQVSEEETPIAQGVVVLVSGVVMAALTFFCGALYFNFGGHAFYGMALVAFIGLTPIVYARYAKGSDD